jgi:DMSO/TMAO reductase YedYZ molybdopterin-dependent catalytic subunit
VAIGALAVHIAVKLPVIRLALTSDLDDEGLDRDEARGGTPPLSRRGLLRTTGVAAAAVVLATIGSTVPALRRVSVFGVRSGAGPGGVPINKSARAAGVTAAALSPGYRLTVGYAGRESTWSRSDLEALPQHTVTLPIACVEGWSASGEWTGIRVRELLDRAGVPRGADVRVESLQAEGPYRVTRLPGAFADDDRTLLALGLAGAPLSLDHGFPVRLIAPNRPGVLQTKWVARLEGLR